MFVVLPPCPDEADDDEVIVPLPPIAESAQLNIESLDMLAATSDLWWQWSAESLAVNMVVSLLLLLLRPVSRVLLCKLASPTSARSFRSLWW